MPSKVDYKTVITISLFLILSTTFSYAREDLIVEDPPIPILSDLTITPAEVELGDEVNITFVITNIDSRSCVFVPFVKIGKIMIMYRIELEGYESNVVEYIINQDTTGDFEVEVDGLTGSFTVKPKPSFWDKIPGFSYESIILGLISVIIILWYARARKL